LTAGAVAALLAGVTLVVSSCPRSQPTQTNPGNQRSVWLDPLPTPPAGTTLARPEDFPAGVRIRVRDDSGLAGPRQPMCIAHSRNNWSPDATPMTLSDDGLWEVLIPHQPDLPPLEFKFTLGGWEHGEVDPAGFSVSNRTLPFVDASKLNRNAVVNIDMAVPRFLRVGETENLARGWVPRVAAGRIEVMSLRGGGGRAKNLVRDVWVWLPPRYDDEGNASRQYPVLIMLDGQSMFERPPNLQSEWGMDETASRLFANGSIEPFICIAIPHSGGFRFDEYLTTPIDAADISAGYVYADALRSSQAGAEQFAQYISEVVLSEVRRRFRATSDPAKIAIGGGDVAAGFAYYAASRHPDHFGKALCEDVWLPVSPGGEQKYLSRLIVGQPAPRVLYYGFGDLISVEERVLGVVDTDNVVSQIESSRSLLSRASVQPLHTRVNFQRGTGAGITWWAQRLPEALKAIFPASGTPQPAPNASEAQDPAPPPPADPS
jgi:hypothetical protein